jgi:predicted amidohydrolase
MVPVDDGIELLLIVRTYNEGLPEYYGIQQCFRMSGKTNSEWRREIARTPAFSEYDLWKSESSHAAKKSLTYVLRDHKWQAIEAKDITLGARTPMGIAVDQLRTKGALLSQVGPYKAEMSSPVDNGLITRVNHDQSWICGIHWENTSHVTNHHPADCLHSIVNIGNIPPFSTKAVRGKIYWFKGTRDSLLAHYNRDFIESEKGKMTVASCQFPVTGNTGQNAAWIEDQMRSAKMLGAEVCHFPECALSGYGGADIVDFNQFDWDDLESHTQRIMSLARDLDIWVVLGSSHRLSQGHKPHNSLYLINPEGQVIDRYDKRFCTRGDLDHYTPGDHFVVFEIGDVRCGLLICYDLRFPELYREYLKLGVDVIFQSFYNARHRENCIHPKIMPVTAQARAATNYFYMSLTNSCAPFSWPCYFITPDGLVNNKCQANKPGVLISKIDLSKEFYDASRAYRMDAVRGKLNSGETLQDPRSKNRSAL